MNEPNDDKRASVKSVHTAGPWEVLGSMVGEIDIDGPNDELICQIPVFETRAKEFKDNAKLIAAAPELLAACWATIQYLNTRADHESNDLRDKVSAAYCKACGIEEGTVG